ncbi:competence protein ComEC [Gammaproteobacteria bacterium]
MGDLLLQQVPDLPKPWLAFPLLAVILLVGWRFRALRWIVGGAAGFLWAWFHGCLMLAERLPDELEGKDVVVEGRISSIPRNFGRGERFDLDTLTLTVKGETLPWRRKIRLFWYGANHNLMVGERWQLNVRLKCPHGQMNPGGFDQEGWLFQKGIHAQGTVRPQQSAARLDTGHWRYAINRLRQNLAVAITQALPDSPYLGLMQGLAIGETAAITPMQWDTLTRTGTIHLLAISGSHIVLVAALAYFVTRHAWAWAGQAALWFAAPRAGAVGAIIAALGYAALANFPISTQRAVVMVSVAMIALLIDRIPRPGHLLAQALFMVLLLDPLAVNDAGFWLSFGTVIIIFHLVVGRVEKKTKWFAGKKFKHFFVGWRTFVRIQWGITIALLPLLLMFFQQVAVYAPFANLIAIPWLELVTIPVVLAGILLLPIFPILGSLLLTLADFLLSMLWSILEFFASLPLAIWSPPAPPGWAVVVAIIGALLLIAPRGLPGRWLGVIGLMPLALLPAPRPGFGDLWLTVLDVGQGLSVVIRTTSHTLVYDTGMGHGDGYDSGSTVIVPFLRYVGRQRIDTLLISHADNDHRGGTAALLAALPESPRILGAVQGGEPCYRGLAWNWDGVNFRVIHPTAGDGFTGNDASCVLRVAWAGGALLLTGDIGRAAEARLVAEAPWDLPSTVIVVPHHGSRGSSTQTFVATVATKVVVYACGYRNRFGFPHPEVVARYANAGAQSFDTARQGAIEAHLGPGSSVTVESWRKKMRHYWNSNPT